MRLSSNVTLFWGKKSKTISFALNVLYNVRIYANEEHLKLIFCFDQFCGVTSIVEELSQCILFNIFKRSYKDYIFALKKCYRFTRKAVNKLAG